jgi:hypothetical protein
MSTTVHAAHSAIDLPNDVTITCTDGTVPANGASLAAQSPVLAHAYMQACAHACVQVCAHAHAGVGAIAVASMHVHATVRVVGALVDIIQTSAWPLLDPAEYVELFKLVKHYQLRANVLDHVTKLMIKQTKTVKRIELFAACVDSDDVDLAGIALVAKRLWRLSVYPTLVCSRCGALLKLAEPPVTTYTFIQDWSLSHGECACGSLSLSMRKDPHDYSNISTAVLRKLYAPCTGN